MPDTTGLALALLLLEALPYVALILAMAALIGFIGWHWREIWTGLVFAWKWLKESPSTAPDCWSTSEAERYATLRDGLHATEMHVHEAKSALADLAEDHEGRLKRLEAATFSRR